MFILMFRFQIQLLILISAGFLIRKIKLIDASARNALSTVLIYVIMPANIFNSFLQDDTGVSLYGNMGILLLISFLVQLVVYHLGSRFYRNEDPKRSPVFCYGLLNAGMAFVGLPVVENLYASLGTLYASVYMIPYRLTIWTLGIALFRKDERTDLKKQLLHPCVIAVLLGLLCMLMNVQIPDILLNPVRYLGRCTTGISMLVIGSILADSDLKRVFSKDTLSFSLVRLIVLPLILFSILSLFRADTMLKGTVVLLNGMPAASTTAILAQRYHADHDLGARVVACTTILSMVTIPLLGLLLV